MTRRRIGTVEILTERVYPRHPGGVERTAIRTDEELVSVDAGEWPVYRDDDGSIYWEMTGDLVTVKHTVETFDGLLLSRPHLEPTGRQVIFRSMAFTAEKFAEFRATDPLVVGDEETRRLVFEVTP